MKYYLYIILQAIKNIFRYRTKSLFYLISITLTSFTLFTIMLVTDSIEYIHKSYLEEAPDIVLQNMSGGKEQLINTELADNLISIPGVEKVTKRYWGYYIFEYNKSIITIIGLDPYENQFSLFLEHLSNSVDKNRFKENTAIVGNSIKHTFEQIGYKEKAYLTNINGKILELTIIDFINDEYRFSDVMFVPIETVRKLLNIPENFCTDIVLNIPNKNEIPIIAAKIKEHYPYLNIITKNDIKTNYKKLFFFEKSFFTLIIIGAIIVLCIINLDRIVGFSGEQREMAILRALGWSISDIIKLKVFESFFLVTFSLLLSFVLSFCYVFISDAPIFKGILLGFSELRIMSKLPHHINTHSILTIFLLILIPYILSTIYPVWKAITKEVANSGVK
ncbi:MAG: FtsX-like permease family protein [Calditerrivibrio sp.]|nr:FtsX-like permease family protein [Calditerrivibrio sp.]